MLAFQLQTYFSLFNISSSLSSSSSSATFFLHTALCIWCVSVVISRMYALLLKGIVAEKWKCDEKFENIPPKTTNECNFLWSQCSFVDGPWAKSLRPMIWMLLHLAFARKAADSDVYKKYFQNNTKSFHFSRLNFSTIFSFGWKLLLSLRLNYGSIAWVVSWFSCEPMAQMNSGSDGWSLWWMLNKFPFHGSLASLMGMCTVHIFIFGSLMTHSVFCVRACVCVCVCVTMLWLCATIILCVHTYTRAHLQSFSTPYPLAEGNKGAKIMARLTFTPTII